MGIKRAFEALTTNDPSARDMLVRWLAERCLEETKQRSTQISENHVYHQIVILARWGGVPDGAINKWSRTTIGKLVADILDAWRLLQSQEIK